MKIQLCTLLLNEMEWLPKLYEQHKNFPGFVNWVFVESADEVYAQINPDMVSKDGLSVDDTTEYIDSLSGIDKRIIHIRHGFTKHSNDKAQGKCEARNRYLEIADDIKPDYLVVIDADEFWTNQSQNDLIKWIESNSTKLGFSTPHREIWYPQYLRDRNENLFNYEVKGGFWDILYCRVWKYVEGMRYVDNHNTPSTNMLGKFDRNMRDHRQRTRGYGTTRLKTPEFIHMGFASKKKNRESKNRYYEVRGEAIDPKRKWYTESRRMWETWTPDMVLPMGAQVIKYNGEIPECFLMETNKYVT